ncbi:MAG: hypothetical protein LBQ52_04495 [Helicobacteraceae bacterium]|nr:hypothetical protein [Helicobacteraceae bacterium]
MDVFAAKLAFWREEIAELRGELPLKQRITYRGLRDRDIRISLLRISQEFDEIKPRQRSGEKELEKNAKGDVKALISPYKKGAKTMKKMTPEIGAGLIRQALYALKEYLYHENEFNKTTQVVIKATAMLSKAIDEPMNRLIIKQVKEPSLFDGLDGAEADEDAENDAETETEADEDEDEDEEIGAEAEAV